MSLNFYQAETDGQTASMNRMCQSVISSMQRTVDTLHSFDAADQLQGEAYSSAKRYMVDVYRPLAYGIIQVCEELINQNNRYPSAFRSQVSSDDLVEQRIIDQIQEIDQYIQKYETLSLFGFNPIVSLFENVKTNLEQKLEKLRTYENTFVGTYDTAIQLADHVLTGLAEVQNGNGFSSQTGTFSTSGMDLAWATELETIHYTSLAHKKYGEYLDSPHGDIDKVIDIIRYEERNPEYVSQTDSFLEDLEDRDIVEIKHLMYTAKEPYRTLSMQYLDQIHISSTVSSGSYNPDTKELKFNVEEDRNNPRGSYFTFFHELGHAVDFNAGEEAHMNGAFSEHHVRNGDTLSDSMVTDVTNTIRLEVTNELNRPTYDTLSSEQREEMTDNITNMFIYEGPTNQSLTTEEDHVYGVVQTAINGQLSTDEDNNASDIYGSVTALEISGRWGHGLDYWVDERTGERKRGPNREGFASYYGVHMIENGDVKDLQLQSHGQHLSSSKEHMDEMFEEMLEDRTS